MRGRVFIVLFMIVEKFKNGDPAPVYQRFHTRGRLAPEGLVYVSSWVDEHLQQCFQLMETDDATLIDEWMAAWADLVDFTVHRVMTSQEAAERMRNRQPSAGLDPQDPSPCGA